MSLWDPAGTGDHPEQPPVRRVNSAVAGIPEAERWELRVVCWRIENISRRFNVRREAGDDDIKCVCGFEVDGHQADMGGPDAQATDVHYRARCDGIGVFHWQWIFAVPQPGTMRFRSPQLRIQLRSALKDASCKAMEPDKVLPPEAGQEWLAEGTLALHDMFQNAEDNMNKFNKHTTSVGWDAPLKVQMQHPADMPTEMPGSSERVQKTLVALSLELVSPEEKGHEQSGRYVLRLPTTMEEDGETSFQRVPCGPVASKCTPL